MGSSSPDAADPGGSRSEIADQGDGVVRVSRKQALAQKARLPRVSGKMSVVILAACFALSAVLIFIVARRFPTWIRSEIAVDVWWLVWAIALGRLLYLGEQVSDDHALGSPRNWLGGDSGQSKPAKKARSSGWDWSTDSWGWNLGGADGGEGCLIVLGVILALIVAFFGLWFLIEVAIPGLAFVTYFLIRSMLARVVNDDHGCMSDLTRASMWGLLWATVYTAPLALLVWIAHLIAVSSGQLPAETMQ